MASDFTRAFAIDIMRFVAAKGATQGLRHRRAPLDGSSPLVSVSDLRYVQDSYVESPQDDYSSTSLMNDSYAEVTATNAKGEVCVKRYHGTLDEILAQVLAASVAGKEIPFI